MVATAKVDLVRYRAAHPGESSPGLSYWGHYVAHDNNRDAMGMTLKLSQAVMDTYVGWNAQVLHDLHESESYLYDNTIGDGPYYAWVDPLLTNEWQMIGWNNVQEMTRFGMPGVYAHGDFDTWSPGVPDVHGGHAQRHQPSVRNAGERRRTADAQEVTADPARKWYEQNPPLARAPWNMRDNNNYEETGILVSLFYFANNRQLFLQNFYEKAKRSIQKPRVEGPAAYVLPADDAHPGEQAQLLQVMQRQHVEISKATAAFTVTFPVRAPAGGRGGRGGGGGAAAAAGGAAGAGAAGGARGAAGRGGAGGGGGGRGGRGGAGGAARQR